MSPQLEKHLQGASASGLCDLLALPSDELVGAVVPDADRLRLELEVGPENALRENLESSDCWAVCRHDPLFPSGLRLGERAPSVLFGRGDPQLLVEIDPPRNAVAIVGAPRASAYGREVARTLGRDVGAAGLTVISGMAFGIDACAHRGALEAGRTVAVLGCGPDVAYPAAHRSLWRRIQANGLVLSELPPGIGAWRWALAARNRVLAALAGITVVVEATERSTSLHTASLAKQLRRRVAAVPGPITAATSAAPNHLIAAGAELIRNAEDVRVALGRRPLGPASISPFRLRAEQARRDLLDPDGSIWPVNAYSDVDELCSLFETALDAGIIERRDRSAQIYIYPLSLSEPDPVPAVHRPGEVIRLGHPLKLVEREGEDPVQFTLRLLEDVVSEANQLLGCHLPEGRSPSPGAR